MSEVRRVPHYVSLVLKAHFSPYILKPLKFQCALHLVESYSYNYQRFLFTSVIVHKVMTCFTTNGILGLITFGSISDLFIHKIEILKSAWIFTARVKLENAKKTFR